MPEHYLRLSGAQMLATEAFQWVGADIDDLVRHFAMGIVHGQAGLGKTFAVQAALERLTATGSASLPEPGTATPRSRTPAKDAVRVVQLVFPHRPNDLRVAQEVARSLTGSIPTGVNRFGIQEQALEQLSGAPYLMVVDEAQRLTRHAMEVLRYLYDHTATRLAVLFVGGDGCWETISRSQTLVSRMLRRRQFHPLPGRQVPAMMRHYHPLYSEAKPELLAAVDTEFAHGNWRNWVSFTATAADLAHAEGRVTLDRELVAAGYRVLGRS
ncbi:AAA family ATPase [Saccharothrix hoggarensis]|uniref:AAA family ATPase n=1 Tax=Saccharothrix hoggarensis TaxID=913853 RepID=A0ABW3QLB4_9PSEU